jgi:hypothetical protein
MRTSLLILRVPHCALLVALFAVPAAQATTADADFQARCGASGVILCQGFDDPAVFAHPRWPASGLYPEYNTTNYGGSQDTAVFASGGGSLKFTIPSFGGSDSAGSWRQLFTPNLSDGPSNAVMFKENSTFYVQFQQRFSPEFLTNNWPGTYGTPGITWWKQEIISNDNSTCGSVELTTVNAYQKGYPTMYSHCGDDGFQVPIPNFDYLNEQGASPTDLSYNCHYHANQNVPGSCFMYPANTWVTFYYKVSIGTWGQPNSTIQAWVSVGGQPYVEWVNIQNHTLNEDPTKGADYDMITLTPYMSYRISSISAGPTAYTWYDELIVSTQPIAVPGGTPPPPPSACDVNGDGSTNVADVQLEVNMALGISTCTNPSGACSVVSVQRVVNAALGGTCVAP